LALRLEGLGEVKGPEGSITSEAFATFCNVWKRLETLAETFKSFLVRILRACKRVANYMAPVKDDVVKFAREYYSKHGKVPSVRALCRRFRGVRFYSVFPGGIRQLCREASVPVPISRLKAVSKALKARTEFKARSNADQLNRLERLLDILLKHVLGLYVDLFCLEWATISREDMENFLDTIDEDARNLMKRIVEENPDYGRELLLKDNPFLDYVSGRYMDPELLEKYDSRGLERLRKWTSFLRQHCPESEYLESS
jgi:sulfur relay (sulfurtransferase) DsrC/TusE family protein